MKLSPSIKLAIIYLAFSIAWIMLSDDLVASVANRDADMINKLQHAKGLLFVASSGALLYFSSRKLYEDLNKTLVKKEEALEKLGALNEATEEGIIDYDIRNDTAVINDQMREWLGLGETVVPQFSKLYLPCIHPSDKTRLVDHFKDLFKRKSTTWQTEYRCRDAKGNYRDILGKGYLIRDKQTGDPLHLISALHDLTEIRDVKGKYYQQQVQFRQSVSKMMIDVQEKERNRWAEELHDNVAQVLTVARLFMEQAQQQDGNPYLQKSKNMIDTAISDIRQMSSAIKPPEFSHTTLCEALEGLVANIKRVSTFEYDLHLDQCLDDSITAEHKLMIYRVVQEQFSNILKYAQATRVSLHIKSQEHQVLMLIKDNGKGFDPEQVKAGIGLKNIRSRLQAFSGHLTIDSAPGKGCELKACFSTIGS